MALGNVSGERRPCQARRAAVAAVVADGGAAPFLPDATMPAFPPLQARLSSEREQDASPKKERGSVQQGQGAHRVASVQARPTAALLQAL